MDFNNNFATLQTEHNLHQDASFETRQAVMDIRSKR